MLAPKDRIVAEEPVKLNHLLTSASGWCELAESPAIGIARVSRPFLPASIW